jgi:hypothetical protein
LNYKGILRGEFPDNELEGQKTVLSPQPGSYIFLTMSTNHPVIPTPVFLGHILLIATGVLYSIYWIIKYYDTSDKYSLLLWFLFSVSIVIGFVGIFFFYTSSVELLIPDRTQNGPIIITGIALFVISLIVMHTIFKRPFTSEIFFAFLWAVSEMNIIYSVYTSGGIGKWPFYIIAACVLACTAVNLVCYRIHLQLADFKQFINGLIPYIVTTFFMTAILIILFLSRVAPSSE